jgi:hypothetical protein
VYTGDYVHGEFHGKGELKCIDGRSYTGAWVTGKKHGEGTGSHCDCEVVGILAILIILCLFRSSRGDQGAW